MAADSFYVPFTTLDYQPQPSPSSFSFQPSSASRMCTTITIANDGVVEVTENFFADLVEVFPLDRVVLDLMQTEIIINDTDGKYNNVLLQSMAAKWLSFI